MISICIPLKNRAQNVVNCLDSLSRLNGDFEVVIADNNSTDINWVAVKTSLIGYFPIKVVSWSGDWSIGRAKNIAAENSKGDILFFLDADVVVPQDVIDKIVSIVPSGWVYSPIMWLESKDRKGGEWAVHSFGQVALRRDQWESHKWVEWTSYGGDDNLFIEPYLRANKLVRDTPFAFVHQWHSHEDRTKNYKHRAGHHLDIENKRRSNA